MAQKKETATQLSQEDNQQIQDLFSRYHQIAEQLHNSADQAQTEAVLGNITLLSAPVQLALLKTLARENNTDAADVLAAIHTLSTHKAVRKEARRGLIRLEATKAYPRWKSPVVRTPAIQLDHSENPRFWKGLVTQSREQGEVYLVLCWEQGYDYSEVCMIIFSLDYWYEGIKDVIFETLPKRRFDERLNNARIRQPEVTAVDCTLAEGKRLTEEALSTNQWHGKTPHENYRQQLPLINKLIMQATDLGEDRGHTFINPELEEQEVILNFLGAWSFGDYRLAYDLLSHDSSVRDGLSRDEWIERHRAWHQEAHPTRMDLAFVREREIGQSALWLPSSISLRSPLRKNIEVGWSLELSDTPLSGTLQEMPMGTAINKETGRYWFWTRYTFVREDGGWRIEQSTDEGLILQGLFSDELQSRIKEYQEAIEQSANQHKANRQMLIKEVYWRLTQVLYFYDALIAQLPLDYQIHEAAYAHSLLLGDPERTIVYLELMVQRFQESRGGNLHRLGTLLTELAYSYDPQRMPKRCNHLLQRAEETLREAIAINDNIVSHVALAELLMNKGHPDEAEAELHKAQELNPGRNEEASIEAGLGHIAMQREQISEALTHYKRVVTTDPDHPGIWFSLGFAHRLLKQLQEAEKCYQQSIQVEPGNLRAYSELTTIYINSGRLEQARAILEQAIQVDPESAYLHALLASVHLHLGDRRVAQQELEEAERIDPALELTQKIRQHIHRSKRK